MLTRLRVVGDRIHLYHLARLYRTLGMLLEGGIPIARAMHMSSALLPDRLRSRAAGALESIRQGVRPSVAFAEYGLSTPISTQFIAVGERTGDLGTMLTRTAQFYEADTARRIERFLRVFEPTLMIFIGLGIGLIIVLMYLPIFELASAIQ